MEQALLQLGLNAKEVRFYLFLLTEGHKTGSELAKDLKENRTNTYMVLNKLGGEGVVEFDDSSPVRRYQASDPENLKTLVVVRQQQLRQAHSSLTSVLPELNSLFNLNQHKPGVIYFEGLSGYQAFQEDIARSDPPIDVFASNVVPENKEAWKALQKAVQKRAARGTAARIIFHNDAKKWLDLKQFQANGYEVRFWGEQPLAGEIVIYGNKLGLTTYQPQLITTVITNDVIAATFRAIFDQLWQSARLLSINIVPKK
ncbi:MAG: TrmB family transcriptional regulator [Candidatus Saccharimonadales bacterium]